MSRLSTIMLGSEELQSRNIAYNLIIELLAHQFAFPVRWIDTQNELFSREKAISRIIELGPSNILANMAQKTRDSKFLTQDTLTCFEREILASTKNIKQIQYQYDQEVLAAEEVDHVQYATVPDAPPSPVMEKKAMPVPMTPQAANVAATSIADVPTSALEIIRALVAYKLRKSLDQVVAAKSIKDLSAGKSTLQNELIGDITNEFGSSPDGAEDLSLTALAEVLEPKTSGQLGKTASDLIARFISSMMPARFNLNSIREHLKQTWGIGPSRQSSVMLVAMTMSVTDNKGRLPSVQAAKQMLDAATAAYAQSCGLILEQKSSASSGAQSASTAVDSAVLEKFTTEQKLLATMQHKTLSSYLGVGNTDPAKLAELERLQQTYQERLDLWSTEFGTDFEVGIRSSFNPKHLRHFNFWWNQARIELYKILTEATDLEEISPEMSERSRKLLKSVANKASEKTMRLIDGLSTSSSDAQGFRNHIVEIGRSLISEGLLNPPVAQFALNPRRPRTQIEENGTVKCVEISRVEENSSNDAYATILRGGSDEEFDVKKCLAGLRTQQGGRWEVSSDATMKLFESMSTALGKGISFAGKVVLVTGAGQGSIGAELVRKLLMGGATVIVTTSRAIADAQEFFRKIYAESGARGSELFVLPFNQGSLKDCTDLIHFIYSESGLNRNLDFVIPFAAISEAGMEVDQLQSKSELAHRMMLVNILRLIGCIAQQKTEQNINCWPTQVLLPLSPNHGTFGGDGLYGESKLGLEGLLNRFSSESWGEKVSVCGVLIGWTRGTGLMESNDILAETVEVNGGLTFSQEEMALNILTLLAPEVSQIYEDEPIIADFGGGLQYFQDLKTLMTDARLKIRQESEIKKAIYDQDALEQAAINNKPQGSPADKTKAIKNRSTHKIQFPQIPHYDYALAPLQGMVDLSNTVVVVGFSELGPWGNSRTRWQMESQHKLTQAGTIELACIMGLIKHFDGDKVGKHYVGWVDTESGDIVEDDQVPSRYEERIMKHTGIRLIEPDMLNGYDPDKKEYLQEVAVEDDLPEFDATLATAEAFKLKHGEHCMIRQLDEPDSFRVTIKSGAKIMVPKSVPLSASVIAGLLPTGWDPARYGISDDIIKQVDVVTIYTLVCVAEAFFSAGIEDPMEIYKYFHVSEIGNFIGSSIGGTDKTREMYRDIHHDKQVQGDVIQETNLNTPAAWVNMLLLGGSGPIKTPVGACATGIESIDIGFDSISQGKTKMCVVGGCDNFQEDESYAFSTMKATVNTAEQFAQGRRPAEMSRPTAETRAGFVESQGCGVQILCNADIALKMGLPIYAIVAGSTMAADKIGRSLPAPGQGVLTFAREAAGAADSPLLSMDYRRQQMKSTIAQLVGDESSESDTSLSEASTPPTSVDGSDTEDSDALVLRKEFSKEVSSGLSRAGTKAIQQAPTQATISNAIPQNPLTSEGMLDAQINAVRRQWGNQLRAQNPMIAPMRAALAVWGLTIDDISVASLHGTSTKANDINEPSVLNQQMSYLGRKAGPMLAICQKSITGHPKAPAAAWMLNGCLQVLDTGLVPGNFNCDNIDPALEKFEHLLFPAESIQTKEVKAFLLSSFGFGQKGGQMVGVAPKYLFATLKESVFKNYAKIRASRQRSANQAFAKAFLTDTIFKAQAHPPYKPKDEAKVLLDPLARIRKDSFSQELVFDPSRMSGDLNVQPRQPLISAATNGFDLYKGPLVKKEQLSAELNSTTSLAQMSLSNLLQSAPPITSPVSIGIDFESLPSFTSDSSATFLERNYTDAEREYALQTRDPHSTYVSRWCAKEAVFKCLGAKSKGAGAPLKDIEVFADEKGAPKVRMHGAALEAAMNAGIEDVLLSISYGDENVVAVAVSLSGAS